MRQPRRAKRGRTIGNVIADGIEEALRTGEAFSEELEAVQLQPLTYHVRTKNGKGHLEISFSDGLTDADKRRLLEQELKHVRNTRIQSDLDFLENMGREVEKFAEDLKREADLSFSSVIVPERRDAEGVLVKSASVVWDEIVRRLSGNWDEAFTIPDRVWEEIIAGAFVKAGYQEVVLTPRSGDYGRDVIARTKGIGCVKIIGSVKAYARGRPVPYDDIRSLIGVLSGERDASKGIITTTSHFPPRVARDKFIAPFLPTRLELVSGHQLQEWLNGLLDKEGRF